MARPSKLVDAQGDVLAALKVGMALTDAAAHARIDPRTLRRWLRRGERERDAGGGDYADFLTDVEEARQATKVAALATLHNAMNRADKTADRIRAAERLLLHVYPEQYGMTYRVRRAVDDEVGAIFDAIEAEAPDLLPRVVEIVARYAERNRVDLSALDRGRDADDDEQDNE